MELGPQGLTSDYGMPLKAVEQNIPKPPDVPDVPVPPKPEPVKIPDTPEPPAPTPDTPKPTPDPKPAPVPAPPGVETESEKIFKAVSGEDKLMDVNELKALLNEAFKKCE